MTQIRVNIRSVVNSAAIRHETRNGREIIVVPSATLPDNVIMNGIKYPADEIAKSYTGLDRTHAPLGHPVMNGEYVSASDPEAVAAYSIGAWNENPRREGGVVYLDKVIDVETATQSDRGQSVLNAIKQGDPIHTSTGLVGNLFDPDGDDHDNIIRNMVFDHDAILLNEDGAATPAQGVGMMVNSDGDKIRVVNSVVEMADEQLDWAILSAIEAFDRKDKAGLVSRIKAALAEVLSPAPRETPAMNGDADMADENQIKELSAKVDALAEAHETLANSTKDIVTNAIAEAVAPLVAANKALEDAAKEAEAAELSGYVDAIVNANLMPKDAAETLTLNQAKALAPKDKGAAPINGATVAANSDDEWVNEDPNELMKEA